MIKRIMLASAAFFALLSPCFAQDVVTPAEAASDASEIAQKWLALTEEMIAVAKANEGDCQNMAIALRNLISKNQDFLRALDYTTQQADETIIQRTHENAEALGKILATCYDDENIARMVSGWTSM